jgi:hypothetical protein
MAKSLIKTVDGIGIWVSEGTNYQLNLNYLVIATLGCLIFIGAVVFGDNDWTKVLGMACVAIGICMYITVPDVSEVYEVYLGSEDGIIIPKTTDPKADQIAICKAAKEIEAKCHEIANKRRELDHIAESCK